MTTQQEQPPNTTAQELLEPLFEDLSVTDIHLSPNEALFIRKNGELEWLDTSEYPPPSAEALNRFVETFIPETALKPEGVQFAFNHKGYTQRRLRAIYFPASGEQNLSLRLFPTRIPEIIDLGLPLELQDLMGLSRGLILIVGSMGSGKTTTCASLLNYQHSMYCRNIVTLEDPIEYNFPAGKSKVRQREIGVDVDSWETGLFQGLRQDVDTLFCGELRSEQSILTALEGAETSQLIIATMHANSAAEAIERIVEKFPDSRSKMIRSQLARTLTAIVCQWLLPASDNLQGADRGRVLLYEILLAKGNSAVAQSIRDGKTSALHDIMHSSGKQGMITVQQYLEKLVQNRRISEDTRTRVLASLHQTEVGA